MLVKLTTGWSDLGTIWQAADLWWIPHLAQLRPHGRPLHSGDIPFQYGVAPECDTNLD